MKGLKFFVMVATLLLGCLTTAAQKDLSFSEIEARAKQGDFQYMRAMGKIYQRGLLNQPKDEALARQWYRAAFDKAREEADKGNKEAMNLVLTFYMKDNWSWVVDRDSVEAMRWFQKALDFQFARVQYLQARMDMQRGRWEDAVKMLQKLMANPDNKDKDGAGYLGDCYYYGRGGLQRNYSMAYKYFKIAIEEGHDESKDLARSGMGLCYYYGRGGVKKNVTQAVKYWLDAGIVTPEAGYLLGYCQIKGIGTVKDVKKGCETLRRLMRQHDATVEQIAKAEELLTDTEAEIAHQNLMAEKKKRQEAERRRAERERQNLIYEGAYTQTGFFIGYIDGSFNNYGGAYLHQVKICRDILYVDGKSYSLAGTNGSWLFFGQNQGEAEYLYNTQSGDFRKRDVTVFFGKIITDNLWVKGDAVAVYSAPAASYYSSPSYGGGSSTYSSTSRSSKVCNLCGGRGWVPTEEGVPTFGSNSKKWCKECHETVNIAHWHKPCPSCKGRR